MHPRQRRPRLVRVFPTRPGDVPVRLFASVLRSLLNTPSAPNQGQLEARSGVPARTIYRVLNSVDRSVSFDVADALLTALDATHLWHESPLDAFLLPPPDGPFINPTTPGQERARQCALRRCNQRSST